MIIGGGFTPPSRWIIGDTFQRANEVMEKAASGQTYLKRGAWEVINGQAGLTTNVTNASIYVDPKLSDVYVAFKLSAAVSTPTLYLRRNNDSNYIRVLFSHTSNRVGVYEWVGSVSTEIALYDSPQPFQFGDELGASIDKNGWVQCYVKRVKVGAPVKTELFPTITRVGWGSAGATDSTINRYTQFNVEHRT